MHAVVQTGHQTIKYSILTYFDRSMYNYISCIEKLHTVEMLVVFMFVYIRVQTSGIMKVNVVDLYLDLAIIYSSTHLHNPTSGHFYHAHFRVGKKERKLWVN